MPKKIKIPERLKYIYLLIAISAAIRLAVVLTYAPIDYPDTGWYEKVAKEIVTLDFSKYDGARTPGYPALMILGFLKWKIIWFLQLALGIAISAIMYLIINKATSSPKLSFYTGLSYNLSIVFLFFESNMLTETLSIFFLLLSVLFFMKIMENRARDINYFYLSLMISLASITRPTFLFLLPMMFIFFIYGYKRTGKNHRFSFKKIIYYTAPFFIIIGGWSTFNKIQVDYFGPTTLTGFHLMSYSGAFIEDAPEEYGLVKKIYLKHREVKLRETGDQTTTIWMAYPEMMKVKGYTIAQISKELTALSIHQISRHPELYFKMALKAYWDYWYLPNFTDYWKFEKFRFVFLGKAAKFVLYYIELPLWIAANAGFILFTLFNLYGFFTRKKWPNTRLIMMLSLTVISLSVLQALAQYGDNWRYSVSMKPFIILVIALTLFNMLKISNKPESK